MAIEVFKDAHVLLGAYDLSADHNTVKLEAKADSRECTRFGYNEHRYVQGLLDVNFNGQGFCQWGDDPPENFEEIMYAEVTGGNRALTVAPKTTDGSVAYVTTVVREGFSFDLSVGEIPKFDWTAKCAHRFGRGVIMLPLMSRLAAGSPFTSTIYQLGALSASQKMLFNIHVTAFAGSDLDIEIFSNDTNNTTTPTSRASQANISAVGSHQLTVDGAITDTYWYAVATFTGTSFSAAISAGKFQG